MKFVRIRPYNKARGQLNRRYVYGGFRFEADHGWYEVDDEIAEYLKGVLTSNTNPDSKPVFDVADKIGAEKIARDEYEAENPERKISEALSGAQSVKMADLDLEPEVAEAPSAPAMEPEPEEASPPAPHKKTRKAEATSPGGSRRESR